MIARGTARAQVAPDTAGAAAAAPRLDDDRGVPVATFAQDDFPLDAVVAHKRGRSVSVCVPAHNEIATVSRVVTAVQVSHLGELGGSGLVDEVLVVDDGSTDGTAEAAAAAGARVVRLRRRTGKGGAMRAALDAAVGDVLVFLDADVENTTGAFVTSLLGPLLVGAPVLTPGPAPGPTPGPTPARTDQTGAGEVALVKGYYERPIDGSPTGGGRVTELVARPVLEVLFPELPELAAVLQPLAGETAAPRWVLEKVDFAPGYGVEIGLLVDVAIRFGAGAIAQVDLGCRVHRNRSLEELRPQSVEVLRAALVRAERPAG